MSETPSLIAPDVVDRVEEEARCLDDVLANAISREEVREQGAVDLRGAYWPG